MIPANPAILRRWLLGIALFTAVWFLLLWPLATALYGPSGEAASSALQADRLIFEELVKLVLLVGVAGLAAWLGVRTLMSRSFPPTGFRVPIQMSVNRGSAALVPGLGLLLVALVTLAFRIASLRVTLELAELLRQVG
jgi:hypothetical protein